jgi:hypothetical protein
MRKCKCGCNTSIEHKHPNAKFYNQKHKDKYHNKTNPRGSRGHFPSDSDKEHEEIMNEVEVGWDAHKEQW